MITEKQLANLSSLSLEDKHAILQELVNEWLIPKTVYEYCEIMGIKGKEKTIYNRIQAGKLKGIVISGVQFVYMNQL
jgi:hypothetical protein